MIGASPWRRWCVSAATAAKAAPRESFDISQFKKKVSTGPDLEDFMTAHAEGSSPTEVAKAKKKPFRNERLPPWLKISLIKEKKANANFVRLKSDMRKHKLATVCEEAKCPNIAECWGGSKESATTTIMLMGDTCTRGCRFCAVKTSRAPAALDPNEPMEAAESVKKMGVGYVVLTMVDRDDQPDGGAEHVARCIEAINEHNEGKVNLECLTGDFRANREHVQRVAQSGLKVFAHNIETVERLTPRVRDRRATYLQSMKTLEIAKQSADIFTKSSIMLGLGERDDEIMQAMRDLRTAGVECLTLGQYLQPLRTRMKVHRYVHPDEFEKWRVEGLNMGFYSVQSGPMVRSSYKSGEYFASMVQRKADDLASGARQPWTPHDVYSA
eukprot:TRINITY_DN22069_c0_g1_i1.p1 TRINITY_DN22069_c0_g1~~TRINITY_DN22069_c0_g1_i1.p1  ORF type:complete len:384 (+),score=124.88 TRINITY_DN22069_c0_g1_i1:87-1238(+)